MDLLPNWSNQLNKVKLFVDGEEGVLIFLELQEGVQY